MCLLKNHEYIAQRNEYNMNVGQTYDVFGPFFKKYASPRLAMTGQAWVPPGDKGTCRWRSERRQARHPHASAVMGFNLRHSSSSEIVISVRIYQLILCTGIPFLHGPVVQFWIKPVTVVHIDLYFENGFPWTASSFLPPSSTTESSGSPPAPNHLVSWNHTLDVKLKWWNMLAFIPSSCTVSLRCWFWPSCFWFWPLRLI